MSHRDLAEAQERDEQASVAGSALLERAVRGGRGARRRIAELLQPPSHPSSRAWLEADDPDRQEDHR